MLQRLLVYLKIGKPHFALLEKPPPHLISFIINAGISVVVVNKHRLQLLNHHQATKQLQYDWFY